MMLLPQSMMTIRQLLRRIPTDRGQCHLDYSDYPVSRNLKRETMTCLKHHVHPTRMAGRPFIDLVVPGAWTVQYNHCHQERTTLPNQRRRYRNPEVRSGHRRCLLTERTRHRCLRLRSRPKDQSRSASRYPLHRLFQRRKTTQEALLRCNKNRQMLVLLPSGSIRLNHHPCLLHPMWKPEQRRQRSGRMFQLILHPSSRL